MFFCFPILNANAEGSQPQQNNNKNKFLYFIDNFWAPKENPAFGTNKHMIGITYGYDYDRLYHNNKLRRNLHTASIQYSAPFKFFNVNARYSFGFFTLLGRDKAAVNKKDGEYRQIGIEFLPEIIIGCKNLYFTAGVGASYMLGTKRVSYLSYHNPTANGVPTQNDKATGGDTDYHYNGMTYFNFVLTASVGHRFDNGMVVEIMWKHYSNGGLGSVNYDVNAFGASLRYAFSI